MGLAGFRVSTQLTLVYTVLNLNNRKRLINDYKYMNLNFYYYNQPSYYRYFYH